jgi:hypothetical protein
MNRNEAIAVCKQLLEGAVVSGSTVSGNRQGELFTVRFTAWHWEVATPISLHGGGFLLKRELEPPDHHSDLDAPSEATALDPRQVYYTEGMHYRAVSTPWDLLERALSRAESRVGGEERKRLQLQRLEAAEDTLVASFGYHYYLLDAALLEGALELLLGLRDGIGERVVASENDEAAAAQRGRADDGPYRESASSMRRPPTPPVAYRRALGQLEGRLSQRALVGIAVGAVFVGIWVLGALLGP